MSKPAVVFQKPKPEAMFCRCRLAAVLEMIIQNRAAERDDEDDLEEDLAHLGPVEEIERAGRPPRRLDP